jgi:hypothetical protein
MQVQTRTATDLDDARGCRRRATHERKAEPQDQRTLHVVGLHEARAQY